MNLKGAFLTHCRIPSLDFSIGELAKFAVVGTLALGPASSEAQIAPAESRIALIVGNSDYETLADLPNAHRDASRVSEYFQSLGYDVVSVEDADLEELSEAISETVARTTEGATVVFYFAGHGLQVGSGNFLLPRDSAIESLHDLPFAAVSLGHVMSILSARAGKAVFILDSCRDNPFLNQMITEGLDKEPKPIEAGFFFQQSPIDTFIAFSTSPGELALDGPEGGNSPFTSAFVANSFANPGADISAIMARTRRDVHVATDGRQLPWESSSLTSIVALGEASRQSLAITPIPLASSDVTVRGTTSLNTEETEPLQIEIEAQFEREILIGQYLSNGVPSSTITVVDEPIGGDIAVVEDGLVRVLQSGDTISEDVLTSLVFRPRVARFESAALETLTKSGRASFSTPDQLVNVSLSLPVNACDLRAGGVLDPQGVGPEVYPHEFNPSAARLACQMALDEDPSNARFRTQLARAMISEGNIDAARLELIAAIQDGHIRAMRRLGMLEIAAQAQEEGMVRIPAPPLALDYLESAHSLGDPLADYALGNELLRFGEGKLAQDRGYALLMRAHSAGYIEAINELARYFAQSNSQYYDPGRALRYFEATAQRGNINGQSSLGFIYQKGLLGVDRDYQRAIVHYKAAAAGGHPRAPNDLGIIYQIGEGVTPDLERALRWYDTGLNRGDPWAGANAAQMIIQKSPPGTTRFDAAMRAGRAAALGSTEGAKRARDVLDELGPTELAGGAQALLIDLGAEISVDGDFGPASMAALAAALGPSAQGLDHSSPLELLLAVADAHWEKFGFRLDLL